MKTRLNDRAVILALMPLGVEHRAKFRAGDRDVHVILALMPLGVEHDIRIVNPSLIFE